MRNNVYAAPTIMPPTAMGRTMNRQTEAVSPDHEPSVEPAGRKFCSCGPRKKISSGIRRPHANTPPENCSAASSGPMM